MYYSHRICFCILLAFAFLHQPVSAQLGGLFGGPSVETIQTKELQAKLDAVKAKSEEAEKNNEPAPEPDFVLIDVRSDAETKVSVIPGAITKAEYEKNVLSYQDKVAIPYCTIGGRSGQYAKALKKSGTKVLNYQGSILEWVNAGLPLVTLEGKPTNRVHIYADRYQIPQQYEAVTN